MAKSTSTAKRPHVLVNTRLLLPDRLEGLGRFTWEVLQRMVASQPEVQFTFVFDRPWDPQFIPGPNVRAVKCFPPARHPLLYWLYFELAIPQYIRSLPKAARPDVFFSPDGYLSLRATLPQVPVMHDIAYMHFPEYVNRAHRWHYHRYFPRYAQKAAHILTVSEYSKQDIVRTFQQPAAKVSVCYNGSASVFQPQSEQVRDETRQQYSEGLPYFLYVGSIHPRKNLTNVLRAYEQFRSQSSERVLLLLTGRKAWDFDQVVDFYQQMTYKDDVRFTGYLSDAELNKLLNAALALTYVSRFEGFGLPILEAMYAETAVICSNTSSMPEVAGDAALAVSPDAPDAIAAAMRRVSESVELRAQLIAAGRQQRQKFTWDNTTNRCWQVLSKMITIH